MENEKKKPEAKYAAGAMSVSVWKNVSSKDPTKGYYSLGIDKRYKDAKGVWKSTTSLMASDVPNLLVVLNKAYEFMNASA